jgi:vacuolar protein sorting-associated protein 13A/C
MTRAGMALLRMGRLEDARILDDVDLTLALDSRSMSSHQMTSIEITFKPIILRASYRDIMLILTIVNKVMEAYGRQAGTAPRSEPAHPSVAASNTVTRRVSGGSTERTRSYPGQPNNLPLGTAHVVLSKEQVRRNGFMTEDELTSPPTQLKASFDGFRLILIGDLHEQPLLHLVIKPFFLSLNDWSGEVCYICDALSVPSPHIDR